jgi:hypothetical protein
MVILYRDIDEFAFLNAKSDSPGKLDCQTPLIPSVPLKLVKPNARGLAQVFDLSQRINRMHDLKESKRAIMECRWDAFCVSVLPYLTGIPIPEAFDHHDLRVNYYTIRYKVVNTIVG